MRETAPVMDEELDDTIDSLDAHIETLTAEIVRCRKIALAARVTIASGVIWFGLALVRVVSFTPEMLLVALVAVIGGVVVMGSNKSTWEQTETALSAAETRRRRLIGRLELRLVGEERPTVH